MSGFFKLIGIGLSVFLLSCAGPHPGKSCKTYAEAPDPAPDSLADWSQVPKRLQVSFGSIDTRYAKSAIPAVENVTEWHGAGWRGERISSQVVLWSPDSVEQVTCAFSPFKSKNSRLDASIALARFVRYVLADCLGINPECPPTLSADVLDTISCFNIEAKTTRPLWLSFDIPADAEPGVYSGTLTIFAGNRKARELALSLEVLPQTLPAPSDWAFHLDLWQHPSSVARVNNVKLWSEEHWALLEKPMRMLADAGQKVITATLNKDPWNHQCFDGYEDMIIWTKQKDGSWSYDYSVFDRWVELMMKLGVHKQINCYSMLPWNYELHYFDETKGEWTTVQAKPGEKMFGQIWTPFLKDFTAHLKSKGWEKITNIAMDERAPEEMTALLNYLKRTAPDMGVALADNHKSYKQFPMLKDVCVYIGSRFDEKDVAFRRKNNLVSTYYVCCGPAFPNTFTFSPPSESAYIGWHAVAAGFDGFLRWAYNSWDKDPMTDSRNHKFPSGDTYLIYPGGRSSIRFERLREGIQDAEKIRILREHLSLSPDAEAPAKLAKLNETVAIFSHAEWMENYTGILNNAKKVVEELSRKH